MSFSQSLGTFAAVTLLAGLLAGCGSSDDDGSDSAGQCASNFVAGDLVITEIMGNPSGADESNEWWEVFNNRSDAVSLRGVELVSSREDSSSPKLHQIEADLMIEPGQYLVVGGVLDEAKPSHVDYGFGNDLGDLRNTAGRVALVCGERTIDEAIYADAADGASRIFDGGQAPDSVTNDDLGQWCDSTVAFGTGDLGSPGAANESCGVGGGATTCVDGGTSRDIVAPAVGDIVITELMPNPSAVGDEQGEWFEVLVNRDVDLNGLEIGSDPGTVEMTVGAEDCVRATAGSYVLFARNADATTNGGLPAVDFVYDFGLSNSAGSLFVGRGGAVLDSVSYTSSSDGAATQLDPRRLDPTANDDENNFCAATAAYGDGDLGSPGVANEQCNLPVPAGQCDDNGTLRAIVPATVGDLVVNEIMPNPSGTESENEWFEVLVTRDVDLNGLEVTKQASTQLFTVDRSDCVRATAGSIVVFARDAATNGGLPSVDVVYGSVTLNNSSGSLILQSGGATLDEVTWAASSDGVSVSLDPSFANPVDNDTESNFCDGVGAYGAGGMGTPGAANAACGGAPGDTCLDAGTPRSRVKPVAGDLVINEVMPNPATAEPGTEWFEVLATRDVDLNGVEVTKQGSTQSFVVGGADCVRATTGSVVLFARDADTLDNGGLPAVDVVFSTVTLNNSNGSLVLNIDGGLLDEITWSSSSDGASVSLDPGSATIVGNDTATNFCDGVGPYGPGGAGTPGMPNPMCGSMMGTDMCLEVGVPRPIVKPVPGDLVINEVMANPATGEPTTEWFELLVGARDIDVNGIEVTKAASTQSFSVTSNDCLRFGAGSFVLFARSNDSMANGGLTGVDVVYGSVSLNNTGGSLIINIDSTLLDQVTWTSTNDGASLSLLPAFANITDNDTEANFVDGVGIYFDDMMGAQNRGTPGVANP